MAGEPGVPTFDDHIDPLASRRYYQAYGIFPPEIKVGESSESVSERIEGIRRLCEQPYMDEDSGERLAKELGFLQDSIRKIGNITLKG